MDEGRPMLTAQLRLEVLLTYPTPTGDYDKFGQLAAGQGRASHSFLPAGRPCPVAIQHVRGHPAPTTGLPSLWRHQVAP